MSLIGRLLITISFFHTLLFAGVNYMNKAIVKNGELRLSFSKNFNRHNVKHFTLSKPHRDIYDFRNTRLGHKRVPLGLGSNVRIAQYQPNTVRVVIENAKKAKHKAYQPSSSKKSYHIKVPSSKGTSATKKKKKTYVNPRKDELIVIDAGHGGHDTGAIGGGKKEKDLVLQIAKKLEKQLKKRGYPVHMTRKKDRFLKLSQRTKIADKKRSVAFISIHANSVVKRKQNKIHGVETFFLQNTRDAKSQRIAQRENKSVLKGTPKLSQNIIIDSVLSGPKIVESNKLAIDVQRRIIANLKSRYKGVKDGGVRHAPFWVLVGASRPSILVEVVYISHPRERKRLFSPRYQDLLVKGMAEGIENYLANRKKEIGF